MFTFAFAPNVANSYVLLFGDNYIRFYQDGGWFSMEELSLMKWPPPFGADDLNGLNVEQYRDLAPHNLDGLFQLIIWFATITRIGNWLSKIFLHMWKGSR
jgi:hypothetical protein